MSFPFCTVAHSCWNRCTLRYSKHTYAAEADVNSSAVKTMQEQRGLSQPRDQHKYSRAAGAHPSQISSVYQQKRLPDPTNSQKPAPVATGCSMEAASHPDRQEDGTDSHMPAKMSPVGSKRKRRVCLYTLSQLHYASLCCSLY